MITLTNRPTRALMWSLWLVLAATASVLAGLVAWAAGAGAWSLLAGVLFAGLFLTGRFRPRAVERVYGGWRRLTRAVCRRAEGVLTRTAFLVVRVVGLAGSDAGVLASGGASAPNGWGVRPPLAETYGSASGEAVPVERHGWLGSVAGWARRSGNGWVWALVPILGLLRLVSTQRSASSGGTTYTLY